MGNLGKHNHQISREGSIRKDRFKLYKAGKIWIVAGMATLAFGLSELTAPTTTKAATVSSDQTTTDNGLQGSSVTLSNSGAVSDQTPVSTGLTAASDDQVNSSTASEVPVSTANSAVASTADSATSEVSASAADSTTTDVSASSANSTVAQSTMSDGQNETVSSTNTSDTVAYESPQTKSLKASVDTTPASTASATPTDPLPAGFSVSDPDYPSGVFHYSEDSEWYTFAQMQSSTGKVSFAIDRATQSKIQIGKVTGSGSTLTLTNVQEMKTGETVSNYSGFTIYDDETSVYASGALSYIFDVYSYKNGNSNVEFRGYAFFKPVLQTQSTDYVNQNGKKIADSIVMSGLSGQKYTTASAQTLTGYGATATDNATGTMSPFQYNGQTLTQVLHQSKTGVAGVAVTTITYTIMDVNKGIIDYSASGSMTGSGEVKLGGTGSIGNGSYLIPNPYLPQTTQITYTYQADDVSIKVKYVDQDGANIPDSKVTEIDALFDEETDIPHPVITGYDYDTAYTATATDNANSYVVTDLSADNTVTLHYQAKPETVTIRHIDDSGEEITSTDGASTETTISAKFNTTVDLTSQDAHYSIDGYEIVPSQTTSYLVDQDGENIVQLSYVKQKDVAINYVDQNGNAIDASLLENAPQATRGITGETVPISVPTIDGYTAYTDNPTSYTVAADGNVVTLKYIQTKMTVSVDTDAGYRVVDGNGNTVVVGSHVDGTDDDSPIWPDGLTIDEVNTDEINPNAQRDNLDRTVSETIYAYTVDQSGTKLTSGTNSYHEVYFTRTATVDFTNPDQPQVTFNSWTPVAGAATDDNGNTLVGSNLQPGLDYEMAYVPNVRAGQSVRAYDENGNEIELANVTYDGASYDVIPAVQVSANDENLVYYVAIFTTAQLQKTYVRVIHHVSSDEAHTALHDDTTQTTSYELKTELDVSNPSQPTLKSTKIWRDGISEFEKVTPLTIPGYSSSMSVPGVTIDDTTDAYNQGMIMYEPIAQTVQVEYTGLPDDLKPTLATVDGTTNGTATFTPTTVMGYTPDQASYDVSFAINTDGTLVTPTITVHYTGNAVKGTVTIPSNLGNQTVPDVTGTVGTTVNVAVPVKPGYQADQTTVPTTVNPNGTITTDTTVTYTPIKHEFTIIPVNNLSQPLPGVTPIKTEGTTGELIPDDDDFPTPPGYQHVIGQNITVPAGDTVNVMYVPITVTTDVKIPSNIGDQVVPDIEGEAFSKVNVPVPSVPGYTVNKTTVPATVNADGTITVDEPSDVKYTALPQTVNIQYAGTPTNYVPKQTTIDGVTNGSATFTPDEIPGYTPDQTSYSVSFAVDTKGSLITPILTVTYTGKTVTANVKIPSNIGNQLVPGVTGVVGKTIDVLVPDIVGYTHTQTTVPAVVNPDGMITPTATVEYVPNQNDYTVTPVDEAGTPIASLTPIPEQGKTDAPITVPEINGYTATDTNAKVPATGGNVNVVYTPNEQTTTIKVPANGLGTPEENNQLTVPVNGKTNVPVDVTIPVVPGYTADKTTISVTIDGEGVATTRDTVTYTPNNQKVVVSYKGLPDELAISDQTATGKSDTPFSVSSPTIVGYAPDQSSITGTYDTDDQKNQTFTVTYHATTATSDVKIETNHGDQIVLNVSGTVGTKVQVDVPPMQGYTPDKTTVPATVNPDGTITVDDPGQGNDGYVTYVPNTVTTDVTIPSNKGDQVATDVTGKTGESINVDVPPMQGYTPDKTTVPAVVNPDGTITTDQTVEYTPNDVTANVTIKTNHGNKVVPGVQGTIDTTIDVPVPTIEGYTPDMTTVPATVNPDGTITPIQEVTYTPNTLKNVPFTVPATGLVTPTETQQLVVPVNGTVDEPFTVDVPEVPGYTADKSTVTVTIGTDGKPTTPDVVTYTPNSITVPVNYVDENQTVVGTGTYTGTTDVSTDNFVPNLPTGYDGVTTDKPATTPATGGVITVTVKHHHDTGSYTDSRTITYRLADGDSLPSDVSLPEAQTQTVDYQTDTDVVTHIVTYTPTAGQSFAAVVSPTILGYTADGNAAVVETVTTTTKPDAADVTITYSAQTVKNTLTIPSNKGDQSVPDVTGKVGTTIDVPVPAIEGYTPDQTTVPATINPDGTITTTATIDYQPNDINYTVTPVDENGTPIPGITPVAEQGKTGDHVTTPHVDGYTVKPGTDVKVPTTDPNVDVVYTPIKQTTSVTIPEAGLITNDEKDKLTVPVTGLTNTLTNVDVPVIPGYTADKTTISVTINGNGVATTTDKVTYVPDNQNVVISYAGLPADLAIGAKTVTGKSDTPFDITDAVPTIDGYLADMTEFKGVYDTNDAVDQTYQVTYTANTVKQDVTIVTNQGHKIVPNVTGQTDQTVDVTVPNVPGYTPDKTTVPATINRDGTITVDDPNGAGSVTYTPNISNADVTIPTNMGDKVVPDVSGKTGAKIEVTVPNVPGYTPNMLTVPAMVNPDGTITTNQTVDYTPNTVTSNFTIPSTGLATKPETDLMNILVTGKTDVPVTVEVPNIPGYTADKKTITVTIDKTGQPITTDSVTYTANKIDVPVSYIDGDNGNAVVTTGTYEGTTDISTDDFTPVIPDGYTIDTTDKPDTTPAADGAITITLKHHHTYGMFIDQLPITIQLADGTVLPTGKTLSDLTHAPKTTIQYHTDTDDVTHTVHYALGLSHVPSAADLVAENTIEGYVTTLTRNGETLDDTDTTSLLVDQSGYTKPSQPAITVTISANTISYHVVPTNVTGKPLYGTQPIPETGVTNTAVTIPTIPGYKPVDGGQIVPADGSDVTVTYVPDDSQYQLADNSGTHVWKKDKATDAVNKDVDNSTVTITPVDLSGNLLFGHEPISVDGVAGYEVKVPSIPGYKPTIDTITADNGDNKVTYVPDNSQYQVPSDSGTEASTIRVYQKKQQPAGVTPEGKTVTITPVNLKGDPLFGHDPMTIDGTAGYEVTVPSIPGYKPTLSTIIPTNGENDVIYVPDHDQYEVGTNETPADGKIGDDSSHVYEKDTMPEATNTDGQTVTVTPVDVTGQPLYGHEPMTVPGVAGYEIKVPSIPGYKPTADTITPTNGENKVTYVPDDGQYQVPTDTDPADGSIAGTNTHVYQKEQVPDDSPSVDFDKGHVVPTDADPADGTLVKNNTHVYQKEQVPDAVNPDGKTVTITPVDVSGNPLYGHEPVTVDGVAGYEVHVPSIPGYKPTVDTITADNGDNQVTYVPDNSQYQVPTDDNGVAASNIHTYTKVSEPADSVFVDFDKGHQIPADSDPVAASNIHVYTKVAEPTEGVSVDFGKGHQIPADSDPVTASNLHVYTKGAEPTDGVSVDFSKGHQIPADSDPVTASNLHVYTKVAEPTNGVSVDFDKGHQIPTDSDPVTASNIHVYTNVSEPTNGVSVDFDKGHQIPADSDPVAASNIHVYTKVAEPTEGVSVDFDKGHQIPADSDPVAASNTHVYTKVAEPTDGVSVDFDKGHQIPADSDPVTASNTHVYTKVAEPTNGVSIDFDKGHQIPADSDSVIASNTHVYQKDQVPASISKDFSAGHEIPTDNNAEPATNTHVYQKDQQPTGVSHVSDNNPGDQNGTPVAPAESGDNGTQVQQPASEGGHVVQPAIGNVEVPTAASVSSAKPDNGQVSQTIHVVGQAITHETGVNTQPTTSTTAKQAQQSPNQQLPQTGNDDQDDKTIGMALLGLTTGMLGLVGLKRKKDQTDKD